MMNLKFFSLVFVSLSIAPLAFGDQETAPHGFEHHLECKSETLPGTISIYSNIHTPGPSAAWKIKVVIADEQAVWLRYSNHSTFHNGNSYSGDLGGVSITVVEFNRPREHQRQYYLNTDLPVHGASAKFSPHSISCTEMD